MRSSVAAALFLAILNGAISALAEPVRPVLGGGALRAGTSRPRPRPRRDAVASESRNGDNSVGVTSYGHGDGFCRVSASGAAPGRGRAGDGSDCGANCSEDAVYPNGDAGGCDDGRAAFGSGDYRGESYRGNGEYDGPEDHDRHAQEGVLDTIL